MSANKHQQWLFNENALKHMSKIMTKQININFFRKNYFYALICAWKKKNVSKYEFITLLVEWNKIKSHIVSSIHGLCFDFCPIDCQLLLDEMEIICNLWNFILLSSLKSQIVYATFIGECNWLFQLEYLSIERLIDLRANNEFFFLFFLHQFVTLNRRTLLCDT